MQLLFLSINFHDFRIFNALVKFNGCKILIPVAIDLLALMVLKCKFERVQNIKILKWMEM